MATIDTLVARIRNNLNAEDRQELYAQWASTYDRDLLETQNYVAPSIVAEIALKFLNNREECSILDAGCGTGLVGKYLQLPGAPPLKIDGIDISPAMLREAQLTGVYRSLILGDLTQEIAKPDETYDIVTCVGTFTRGHIGPDPALSEFARITIKDGFIIATILEEIWLSAGYKAEIEKLEKERLVEVVSVELRDYRKGRDQARVVVLRKRGSV